ncbi:hypothetical protein BLJAPNOD_04270 [Ensifer sp. M14]|nr:hypothetical protein BLJAPNOD_04270 [Ensifer sp. M14]
MAREQYMRQVDLLVRTLRNLVRLWRVRRMY